MTSSKDEALELFEQYRAEWLRQAREFLHQQAIGTQLTIDDVRDVAPPPVGVDPRIMGGVFSHQPWEVVGYKRSKRKECHTRPIAVFEKKGEE